MNKDAKIKKQAADMKRASLMVQTYGEMVTLSIQALRYILNGGKSDAVKILDSMGMPMEKVVSPKQVAGECLEAIRALQEKLQADIREEGLQVTPIKTEQLKDGDEIVLSQDFDAFFHQCCTCGHTHSVVLEWSERDGKPVLTTRWTTVDSVPSVEDLEKEGHSVIGLEEMNSGEDKRPDRK